MRKTHYRRGYRAIETLSAVRPDRNGQNHFEEHFAVTCKVEVVHIL